MLGFKSNQQDTMSGRSRLAISLVIGRRHWVVLGKNSDITDI